MKVLHLSSRDVLGGAARAAYRIHKGLLKSGLDSKILVQQKESNEPEISSPFYSKMGKLYAQFRPHVNHFLQKMQGTANPVLHSTNILPSGLNKTVNKSEADIIHLHWINGEMISIKEIAKINKPIVWTLHDMWAFCGAEHYDDWENPGRFKEGYTKENRFDEYSKLDIDRWTWIRKRKYWKNVNFNFVSPSIWLANCLSESKLFKGKEATVIPNGLDTSIFKPTKKEVAREILNLPTEKKIVLYGAMSAESNPIKGYQKLNAAKRKLIKNQNIEGLYFVVFGNNYKRIEKRNNFTTKYLGRINDNITLSLVYSAADVMVVPSIMEAFGQTASEAISCGTPVVAFNCTGLNDIIDHKKNGYLAEPYNPGELANGIEWVLKSEAITNKLSTKARIKALEKFDIDKVAIQYISLYKELIC